MDKLYVAYGSNLNMEQMKSRCPDAKIYDTGVIKNYRLEFRGMDGNSHLTISEKENSDIPVGVFKISDDDERRLDRYEGYPSYYIKKEIQVETKNNGIVKAMVYIMVDGNKLNLPSERYLITCIEGYKYFHFDTEYLVKAYKISNSKIAERYLKRFL